MKDLPPQTVPGSVGATKGFSHQTPIGYPGKLCSHGSQQAGLHPALVTLLISQNLFNAFSPYLTLGLNLAIFIVLLIKARGGIIVVAPTVVAAAIAVLAWLSVVVVFRGGGEFQVILKYLRITATIILLSLVFGGCGIRERFIVNAMNFAFSFHIALIAMQVVWPEFSSVTAVVFGFERETAIIDQYSMRKLGASSSYDTASLFSIAGLLFFGLQFLQTRRSKYFFAVIIAFIAALMSSRTGMAMALVVLVGFFIRMMTVASIGWKLASLFGACGVAVGTYIFLIPLLFHSIGISELQPGDMTVVFVAADYGTTGTLEALTYDHLQPLNMPFWDLLVGFAVDPNTIGKFTDIGYVKFIYHLGIIGATVVILLHLYMLAVTHTALRRTKECSSYNLLARFLFIFLIIALVFNYKSLELYSRGVGDFIFLLFSYLKGPIFLSSKSRSTRTQNQSSAFL